MSVAVPMSVAAVVEMPVAMVTPTAVAVTPTAVAVTPTVAAAPAQPRPRQPSGRQQRTQRACSTAP